MAAFRRGGAAETVSRRPEERVQVELHRTLLAMLLTDFDSVREAGRRGVVRMRESIRAQTQRWLDEWQLMLDKPGPSLVQAFVGSDEHSIALRQMSPFAGVLTQEDRVEAIQRACPTS